MEMIEYIMLGVFMGFLTATSGCLKDINWEPFELRKYIRWLFIFCLKDCFLRFIKRLLGLLLGLVSLRIPSETPGGSLGS
jgi:hypothetical protein